MSIGTPFSPELMRGVGVVERYPGQAEILRYLNFVADRFDLKRDIRSTTRVVAAAYDERRTAGRCARGRRNLCCQFLITAVGLPVHRERAEFPV